MTFSMFIILLFLTIYCLHVVWYTLGVAKSRRKPKHSGLSQFVNVLVPMRNEEDNLMNLVDSLSNQSIAKKEFKVVLIDDGSTDRSYNTAKELTLEIDNFEVVRSNGEGKKAAISTGEGLVSEGFVVTTDADARHHKEWLENLRSGWSIDTAFSVNPVLVESDGFFGKLLSLESMSLAGVSMGSASMGNPVLCSGANLGYSLELKGRGDIGGENFLSGDDMFLLESFRRSGGAVSAGLTKEEVVETKAPSTFSEFLDQRLRWAGKSKGFKDLTIMWHAFVVWFINLVLLISLLVGIFDQSLLKWAIGALAIKTIIDFLFLFLVALRVGRMANLWYFPIVEVLYLPYAALIPLMSLFRTVRWRGRLVR